MSYEQVISDFYDGASEDIAGHLNAGRDVAVICEGDPFFYGSYMYLHDRLAERYKAEVIPGVCSMLGGASVLGAPLVYRNQSLSERRAQALSGFLEQIGVNRARITAIGRGDAEPIATNDTDAGRQWNRRIEVAIYADEATRFGSR